MSLSNMYISTCFLLFAFFIITSLISLTPTVYAQSTERVSIPIGTSTPGCEEKNVCYSPSRITINVGDTVEWTNVDTAAHTVTAGSPADGPSGVFDSSLVMADATYAFTFEEAGNYDYFCMVHPWMIGTIIVQENVPNNNSITITNIDSPNTPMKQGDSFTMIVLIDNPFSVPVPVTIIFDTGNAGTTIITPESELIQLKPGINNFPYNFEISQNSAPGNYVVNIQLWSYPNLRATAYFPPELIDESNSGIITVEKPAQIPQPPPNLEAKTISPYEITLGWKKPQDNGGSDIIGYKIEYSKDSNLFSTLVENTGTTKTSYLNTDLKPDTKYSYRVFAINSVGISESSNEDSATTFKELIPRISRLDTDKPSYQTDGQNDIVVTVTGQIENPYEESAIVDITLKKSNDSLVSSIPQRLPLEANGEFQTQFHLDPEKYATGSYIVEAVYENHDKTTEFGITQNLGSDPNLIVPENIVETANDPRGAYIDPSVVTAKDKEDGTLTPECEPRLGWFQIYDSYTVNCTVTDSDGNSDRDSFKIKIKNAHPVSKISVLSPNDSFEINKTIYFSAEDSYDPDGGTIIQYIWNFRDGNSPIMTKSPEIFHSYKKEGTFDVSLDVIDDENSRSNQSSTVKIPVSANYVWIIVVILVCAIGGGGVIAAKYLLKPKPKISTYQDMSTDNKPENDNDPKKQPSIDMDIEFRSGIEKK